MANYALVLGINHYTPPERGGLRELHGAIPDAQDFFNWVRAADGGNVPEANAHIRISKTPELDPVHEDIEQMLDQIVNNVTNGGVQADRFYFYFAGHGLSVEGEPDQVALCLSRWSDSRRSNALSFEAYKKLLLACKYFKETVFFLDCCRTELLHVKPLGSSLTLRTMINWQPTKPFVAFATQENAESFEAGNGTEARGVFTEVLLKGLRGAAKNASQKVDAISLHKYLKLHVPVIAHGKGFSQKPEVVHSFTENEFLFSVPTGPDAPVSCIITVQNRTGVIDLHSEDTELLGSIDTNAGRTLNVSLMPGSYVLIQRGTNNSISFDVINTNEVQHVNF